MIVLTLSGLAVAPKGCALSGLCAPIGRFLEIPLVTRLNQSIAPKFPKISELVSPIPSGAERRRPLFTSYGA
jgi:hypothetical protein